jgi:signal transduction histidine kinase
MRAAPLDYRTLFLASAFTGAVLMVLLALQTRRAYPGFTRLVAAIGYLTIAIVVADLRGYVPDAIWIIQITGLFAFALIDSGIRLFCAMPRRGRWPFVYVVAAMLGLTYIHFTQPMYLRVILNSVLLIPIFVDAALPFLRTPPKGYSFGYRFTAAVLMMGPVAACVRIVAVYSLRANHELYFSASIPNTLFFCLVMFLLLALAFGFISLTHERVLVELHEAHEQLMVETEERIRVESKLARSERLAVVGRLAGGVAHFFNNQMYVIQLSCSLLRESLRSTSGMPLANIQEIEKASGRSSEITNRLLQYAQSRALWPSRFAPGEFLEGILPELRACAGDRLDVAISNSSEIASVELDTERLKETVLALVRNAADAMPSGGRITVSMREEKLDSPSAEKLDLKPGTFVSLSVADTGSGMDEETQRHIFEPFFTTKSLSKAEGLGLASAFGFIQQSGGTITFNSAPLRGSTFELYLPTRASEVQK